MATPDPEPTPIAPPDTQVAPAPVMLDDWCRQRSAEANQVELLAAFHADQVRHGHVVASAADFATAFEAFRVRPVGD